VTDRERIEAEARRLYEEAGKPWGDDTWNGVPMRPRVMQGFRQQAARNLGLDDTDD
jgi:hypothetical protein